MKTWAKGIANRALGRVGAQVVSAREMAAYQDRQRELVTDLFAVYRAKVFPDLPENDRQIDFLSGLIGTQIPEGIYLLHYLHRSLSTGEGDVVEMGVAQGATSGLLANEILADPTRDLWLYDSFQGLSQPTQEDFLIDDMEKRGTMSAYAGAMANPRDAVEARVASAGFPADRLKVVAGFIHNSAPAPDTVAFAYLDFDLYAPILTGLMLLDERTRSGSVLMIDDYKFFSAGVERAVKEFVAARPQYRLEEAPVWAGRFCALVRE